MLIGLLFLGCCLESASSFLSSPLNSPPPSPSLSQNSLHTSLENQFAVLPSRNPFCTATISPHAERSRWSRIHAERLHHREVSEDSIRGGTDNSFSSPSKIVYSNYLATCVPGLAHILKRELEDLHRPDLVEIEMSGTAAVTFRATREASLYALCWLRSAHRLLELVASTDAAATTTTSVFENAVVDDDDGRENGRKMILRDRQDVHDFIRQRVNAKELLGDGKGGLLTVSVKALMNNPGQLPPDLTHSHYTALTIKNALCDVTREMRGDRPDVDVENPDVPLVAIFLGRESRTDGGASLSLYRSLHPPGSLHRRGYRQGSAIHKAAMKESLAAGLLIEAGWLEKVRNLQRKEDGEDNYGNNIDARLRFMDPMAGSGSLVLEAAMMAADIAPGLMRVRCGVPNANMPPVLRWKSNGQEDDAVTMWKKVLLEATQRAKTGIQSMRRHPTRIQIQANDIHSGAVDIMKSALSNAGLTDFVQVSNMDCYDLDMVDGKEEGGVTCLVATNPPWGVRLTDGIADSWEALRHFIRDKCPQGTEVFILSGDKAATGTLKLKRDRMIPIQTGDQHLRWIQYTIRGQGMSNMEDEPNSVKMTQKKIGGAGKQHRETFQSMNNMEDESNSVEMTQNKIGGAGKQHRKTFQSDRRVAPGTAKSERNEWL